MLDENNTKCNILVADDLPMNRDLFRKIFEGEYNIFMTSNGKEAMGVLKEEDIDIVLLDIEMPVMNGYEVITAMKADPNLRDIPIVVTTGAIDKSEIKALDMGADDFIPQPYTPSVIKKRVDNLVKKYVLEVRVRQNEDRTRYATVLDLLDVAYWQWTKRGIYMSERCNRYAIAHVKDIESLQEGKKYLNYIDPRDAEIYERFYNKVMLKGGTDTAIFRAKMVDGTYRWTQIINLTQRDKEGNIVSIVRVWKDVNEVWTDQVEKLETALNKAREASDAKTDFLSRVSHDMRTPLNGILGLTNLLKGDIDPANVIALEDVKELELSGQYLLQLINDTLDVNKIESGNLELHPTVYDGRSLFNNIQALNKPNIDAKHIKYEVKAENLPFAMLYIDGGRIQQIFMNIIGNAVKFTPEGGTITLDASFVSRDETNITYKAVITDTGIGMSKEFLPHVFDVYTQEHNEITAELKGTGLGMAITKQLVELMGGSLSVTSEQGKGTSFTLLLPCPIATDEQVRAWKDAKTTAILNYTLNGRHILLCEDNDINALVATRLLKSKGIKVDRAENGEIGVEKFRNSEPNYYDVILMDIRMPLMNGLEATEKIRHLDRPDAATVPILAMSANAFEDDIQRTKEVGMNGHIAKPIEVEKMFQTLERILSLKKVTKRPVILLVDDIELNRAILKSALCTNYEILEASDGEEALKVLENHKDVDIVITDIQMPIMNGEELIKAIRANKEYKNIIILANTQFGDAEQEENLLEIGADDFVYKPTTPKIVEIRVRNVLKKV